MAEHYITAPEKVCIKPVIQYSHKKAYIQTDSAVTK